MPKHPLRVFMLALFLAGVSLAAIGQTPPKPMHASELLALVAGGALPENVVHEIARRGLNFHPDPLVHGLLSSKRSPGTVCTGHSSKQELVTVGLPRILTETAGSGSSGVRDDGVGRQS